MRQRERIHETAYRSRSGEPLERATEALVTVPSGAAEMETTTVPWRPRERAKDG